MADSGVTHARWSAPEAAHAAPAARPIDRRRARRRVAGLGTHRAARPRRAQRVGCTGVRRPRSRRRLPAARHRRTAHSIHATGTRPSHGRLRRVRVRLAPTPSRSRCCSANPRRGGHDLTHNRPPIETTGSRVRSASTVTRPPSPNCSRSAPTSRSCCPSSSERRWPASDAALQSSTPSIEERRGARVPVVIPTTAASMARCCIAEFRG